MTARQKDSELKTATATLEITVTDLNDVDRDTGPAAHFSYQLDDPSRAFGLEGDGNLVLARPELFDREKMEKVVVKVLAVEETPTVLDDKVSSALNTSNYPYIPC